MKRVPNQGFRGRELPEFVKQWPSLYGQSNLIADEIASRIEKGIEWAKPSQDSICCPHCHKTIILPTRES